MEQRKDGVDPFAPTTAAEWVDPYPVQEVTLPSGNRARVKRPNLYILGRTGQMPAKVAKAQRRTSQAAPKELSVTEIAERSADIELFIDWVLTRAFIEPRVALAATNGDLAVSMLSADDKAFVVELLEIEV